MAASIPATIIAGQGNAQRNHAVLIPRLAKHFKEIENCRPFGTINLQLDQPLNRSRADYWTRRVTWLPVDGAMRGQVRHEAFGFIKIRLECPTSGPLSDAWIILPEGSTTTYCENQVEIVAAVHVAGVSYGTRCAIHIDHTPSVAAPPGFGEIYGGSLIGKYGGTT
jgi:CTP-dependent riboflavin kinase